ncbi:VWA domain-containing protein [Sulfurovum sp.]|uniref:VWA domain-containing protein n=1 Tax=Sulfurovum sp. TaxID=1969726 RepID=UPI002867BF01|nr:VWA domain-containing protein [Sulfurovum sp.]
MTLLYPSFLWLIIPLVLLLWVKRANLLHVVHLVVLMLIILSLTRPVQEKSLQEATIEAKDIIIALDVSYSMKANDITPTRYDFAKETIAALLEQSPSDNIMLIAFTTNPLLLSPPTTDHALINTALKSLNPEFILTKGTSLKKLFQKLSTMHSEHKNLILMTDGGEEENLEELTDLLHGSKLSLSVLALGTVQGTTVKNKEGTLLKDKEGNLVISRINPLLETLTNAVGGTYLRPSNTPEATASTLQHTLKERVSTVQKMQHHYKEFYQLPLIIALLLFLMVHTRAVKYLLILFTFLGVQAEASIFDSYHLHSAYSNYDNRDLNASKVHLKQVVNRSLQSQILLANTYYKQGNFKLAIQTYKSIRSSSKTVKQTLYYNIANTYAKLEKYDKAKLYYVKTLQLGADEDASHNLRTIAFLSDKDNADLGIAHPKSQSSDSSKSEDQKASDDESRSEDQPSSGSGGGGEAKSKEEREKKEQEEGQLMGTDEEEAHPLSSKTYELINKGYIREKQPW